MPLGVGLGQNLGLGRDFTILGLCCRRGHPCFTYTCLVFYSYSLRIHVNFIFIFLAHVILLSWPVSIIQQPVVWSIVSSALLSQRPLMFKFCWPKDLVVHTVLREIFTDENFCNLKVDVCEMIFSIFIFAISIEPTFELGDRIKRWLWQTTGFLHIVNIGADLKLWQMTVIPTHSQLEKKK